MARMARVVVPGVPHHVTQRGNRRQNVFFKEDDYHLYSRLVKHYCNEACVDIWAYCLMPNHVHLIVVPQTTDALHRSLAEAHRRYTRHVNFREGWRGYLWQGRFGSFAMDDPHLLAAVRYVEMNPVMAGLCAYPTDWKWSSARAHIAGKDDELVKVEPMLELVDDWSEYLSAPEGKEISETLALHERTGRPLGSEPFVVHLEEITGRCLRRRKPGPDRRAG